MNNSGFCLGLAPMEGITVFPMRLWFYLAAQPDFLSTPFLRLTSTYPPDGLPYDFAPELLSSPYRLITQLMAAAAPEVQRVAPSLLDKAPFIELNCGCPAPSTVGGGAGSGLLRSAAHFGQTITELVAALGPRRLAVKMRLGFAEEQEIEPLIDSLAGLPLARLTVHGRTRAMGYKGKARWDLIQLAGEKMPDVPLVASGDIVCMASLEKLRRDIPSASAAIVGRGALRNPWIFVEARTKSPVRLRVSALLAALKAHAYLHELAITRTPQLLEMLTRNELTPCLTSAEAWNSLNQRLEKMLNNTSAFATNLSTHSMGRLKLFWGYLRTSLPAPFFAPQTMRAKNLDDFLLQLQTIANAAGYKASCELPLTYASHYDWMFSGEKKNAAHQQTQQT